MININKLHVFVFPINRPGIGNIENIIPTGEFISDYTLNKIKNKEGEYFGEWSNKRDSKSLANMTSKNHSLSEIVPTSFPFQYTNNEAIEMSKEWNQVWIDICNNYKDIYIKLDKLIPVY